MYTVILQIITKITLQIGIIKISVDTLKWNTKNGRNSNNLIESKKGQRRREGNREKKQKTIKNGRLNSKCINNCIKCKCLNITFERQNLLEWVYKYDIVLCCV